MQQPEAQQAPQPAATEILDPEGTISFIPGFYHLTNLKHIRQDAFNVAPLKWDASMFRAVHLQKCKLCSLSIFLKKWATY